jgi:predicted nucleic acid-binding protein
MQIVAKLSPAAKRRSRPRVTMQSGSRAKTLPLRYIETSALVAALLEADSAARASIRKAGQRFTSALSITEARRAMLRAHLTGRISTRQHAAATIALQNFARRCYIFSVTDTILARASDRFPVEPIRTLDAIHLATLSESGLPAALVTIVTRDTRVRDNSVALGHPVE